MKQLIEAFLVIFRILGLYNAPMVLYLAMLANIMVTDLYCQAFACADTPVYMSKSKKWSACSVQRAACNHRGMDAHGRLLSTKEA